MFVGSVIDNLIESICRCPSFASALKEFESNDRCHNLPIPNHLQNIIHSLLSTLKRWAKTPKILKTRTVKRRLICLELDTGSSRKWFDDDNRQRLRLIGDELSISRALKIPGRILIKEGELCSFTVKNVSSDIWYFALIVCCT